MSSKIFFYSSVLTLSHLLVLWGPLLPCGKKQPEPYVIHGSCVHELIILIICITANTSFSVHPVSAPRSWRPGCARDEVEAAAYWTAVAPNYGGASTAARWRGPLPRPPSTCGAGRWWWTCSTGRTTRRSEGRKKRKFGCEVLQPAQGIGFGIYWPLVILPVVVSSVLASY